jgi:hypothetical protein
MINVSGSGHWYVSFGVGPFRYVRMLRYRRTHWFVQTLAVVIVLVACVFYYTAIGVRASYRHLKRNRYRKNFHR